MLVKNLPILDFNQSAQNGLPFLGMCDKFTQFLCSHVVIVNKAKKSVCVHN